MTYDLAFLTAIDPPTPPPTAAAMMTTTSVTSRMNTAGTSPHIVARLKHDRSFLGTTSGGVDGLGDGVHLGTVSVPADDTTSGASEFSGARYFGVSSWRDTGEAENCPSIFFLFGLSNS